MNILPTGVKVVHFKHSAVTAVIESIWPGSWLTNNSDHEVDRSKDLKRNHDMKTKSFRGRRKNINKSLKDKIPHTSTIALVASS